jgi:hypothetical protein
VAAVNIYNYAAEANANNIKNTDPTVKRSSGTTISADGASAGLSTVQADANAIWATVDSATGVAVATGVSGATAGSVGSSDGVAVPTGLGAAIWDVAWNSQGLAVVSGTSAALWAVVWNSQGLAIVLGDGETISVASVRRRRFAKGWTNH